MTFIPRWVRKLGWVLVGLAVLAVLGWAEAPHPSTPVHSQAAYSACSDAAQIATGLRGSQTPPEAVIYDLVQLAPKVTDPAVSGAFRRFSAAYSADNPEAGLQAIADIDATCEAAGLPS